MPQLVIADFAPQLVWLVITFVALYFLLSKLALPRISGVLEERQNRLVDDLERAEQMKREAEETLAAYESAMVETRGQAHEVTQAARAELAAASNEKLEKLAGELAQKAADAERDILVRRDEALANIRAVAADAAAATLDKLIGVTPERAAVDAAIDQALKERG
jgi:F-type H+-transporting ATPase subunit b